MKVLKRVANYTGKVVLTDFSKAFDLVDYTILINKIIQMGVRRNIIPWEDLRFSSKPSAMCET